MRETFIFVADGVLQSTCLLGHMDQQWMAALSILLPWLHLPTNLAPYWGACPEYRSNVHPEGL